MKVLIDIPEEAYKTIMNTSFVRDVDLTFKQSAKDIEQTNAIFSLIDALDKGTPIPDNATNGDVMQMIFPYYSYERNDYVQSIEDYIVDCMECMEHDLYFGYDWWNAPYQKGGKE